MRWIAAFAAAILMTAVAAGQTARKSAKKSASKAASVPLGLLPIPCPEDNPYSPDKAELGRLLYSDKRLSADNYCFLSVLPVVR